MIVRTGIGPVLAAYKAAVLTIELAHNIKILVIGIEPTQNPGS